MQRNKRSNCQHLLDLRKNREFQKNIYFCFVDYAKAFDCVNHNKLWKFFQEMGIPDHLTCLLRNLYAGQDQIRSVTLSCPTLQPHESQHARPPCPWPSPGVHSNSCPSSWWCHSAISSSVVPFSSCPQSLPTSESFPMSQLFAWGGQSVVVSALASVLPKNTQDWPPLEWTSWISLKSKGI